MAGALYGLGGVGKTQLALEYAHRHAQDYDLIWWIPSENPLTIPATLARLASRLGLPTQGDQEDVAASALDGLRGRDRWLLVFDNAEQPDELTRWQPAGGAGQVLVTSRSPAWGALAQPIQVDVLHRAEAVSLLLRRTPDRDQATADRLAEELGDLPLALEQAAAYLEQTGMPLAAYLSAYRRRRGQLLGKGRPVAYEGQVDTTWQLSTDRLAATARAGLELLHLCAFLAPEAIPLDLFTAAPDQLPPALSRAVDDGEAGVQEAAGACYRYSLITRDQTGIRVHRLVQQVVRTRLAGPERRTLINSAVELLASAFPPANVLRDPEHWRRCAQLLPHVLAAVDHAEGTGLESASLAAVLGRAGTYLHVRRRAEYAAARSLLERAVVLCETSVGPDHIEVASILHSLGLVLRDQADLPGARQQLERALAITEARMGPDHVDVGLILESLSRVLRDQGDLAGARAHLERASTILEGAVGPEHPWVGRTLGNLGRVLHDQGDLTGARAQLQRAVTIYETALGPDHPQLAGILLYLGLVLHDQGDLAGARAHLKRAHRIFVRVLGPEHPTTLGVAHRLEGLDPGLRWPLRQNA